MLDKSNFNYYGNLKYQKTKNVIMCLTFFLMCHVVLFSRFDSKKKFNLPDTVFFSPTRFDANSDSLIFLNIQATQSEKFEAYLLNGLLIKSENSWIRSCSYYKKEIESVTGFYECKRAISPNESWYLSSRNLNDKRMLKFDSFPYLSELKKLQDQFEPSDASYLTILRSPLKRYVAEWLDYTRNGHAQLIETNNSNCLIDYAKRCDLIFRVNASLANFLNCKTNLAANRMTRMLADFDNGLCGFLEHKDGALSDDELLERAKRNLESMSFFGIAEQPNMSMKLFENSFSPEFMIRNKVNELKMTEEDSIFERINDETWDKIKKTNSLDVELYEFALELFVKKLKFYELF